MNRILQTLGLFLAVAALFALACGDDDTTSPPPPQPCTNCTVTLEPDLDNTLYEYLGVGDFSNGKGNHIFAGRTNGQSNPPPQSRRAVLRFDVAGSVPAGAMIDSVFLSVTVTKALPASDMQTVYAHRVGSCVQQADDHLLAVQGR